MNQNNKVIEHTLSELAEYLNCKFVGDPDFEIYSVSSSNNPKDSTVSYINSLKNFKSIINPNTIYIVNKLENYTDFAFKNIIVGEHPAKEFRLICELLSKKDYTHTIHPTAIINDGAKLGNNVHIAANVVIGKNVIIGDNAIILANSVIGDNTKIGSFAKIDALVSIYHDIIIGDHVVIGSGSAVGNEGFGYNFEGGAWRHFPQMGSVVIGDNVEIGSNSCVDRGAIDNTIIGNGVIIDNLVHVAHNVTIGENTAIAGCVGIAGSTTIGKNCLIGGKSSISGHINIVDSVQLNGNTTVLQSITKSGVYSSAIHAIDNRKWNKTVSYLKRIERLFSKEVNKNE